MTIAFTAAGTSSFSHATLTTAVPAGFLQDDIHIVIVSHDGGPPVTTPSGWTKLVETTGASPGLLVFWRRAQTGDVNVVITPPAAPWVDAIGIMIGFRGVSNTLAIPFEVGVSSEFALSTVVSASSITPTINTSEMSIFMGIFGDDNTQTDTAFTGNPPGTMTEAANIVHIDAPNLFNFGLYASYELLSSMTATGTRQVGINGAAVNTAGVLVLLNDGSSTPVACAWLTA